MTAAWRARAFTGLIGFPITPADADGRVDVDGFARLVERLVEGGVSAVGALGSTGTYMYLARSERRRAVEAAVAAAAGRCPVIVGVGALRTDDAVRLARDAEVAGADGVLLAPVSYTPLVQEEVAAHVAAVAAATALPLCLYDNPVTTGFTFTPPLIERLAELANVRGVKTPAAAGAEGRAKLEELRRRLPTEFALGFSVDWHAADMLMAGADAWHSVVGGLLPVPAVRLVEAARGGDDAEVRRLDTALAPVWTLFREHGSLRVTYAAARRLGLTDKAPPRPLLSLAPDDEARVAAALDAVAARL